MHSVDTHTHTYTHKIPLTMKRNPPQMTDMKVRHYLIFQVRTKAPE